MILADEKSSRGCWEICIRRDGKGGNAHPGHAMKPAEARANANRQPTFVLKRIKFNHSKMVTQRAKSSSLRCQPNGNFKPRGLEVSARDHAAA